MARRVYVGYDLGDGETIVDLTVLDDMQVKASERAVFPGVTMPDRNTAGQAIPTAYARDRDSGETVFASSILDEPEAVEDIRSNFKRTPTDLIGAHLPDAAAREALLAALGEGWPEEDAFPGLYTDALKAFADSVRGFTDALFGDEKLKDAIRAAAVNCDQIVFSVGHPTRWSALDVALYQRILSETALGAGEYCGVPSRLELAAESRAAFLYVKNQIDVLSERVLPRGKCALLIDVGSSTIDLTAMSGDSRDARYNSGSNYLGARGIDYLILDWYLQGLQEDEDDWANYQELVRHNPSMLQAVLLSCRMAKEKVFSDRSGKARIEPEGLSKARLTARIVTDLAQTRPLAAALKDRAGLPEDQLRGMADFTWVQLFRAFLERQRLEMQNQGIAVGSIILTGSASKMPFVDDVVRQVFTETEPLKDINPSRSISMGLSLVGPSTEKSGDFVREINALVTNDVPEIVSRDMPALADALAPAIDHAVSRVVRKRVAQWKDGAFDTLEDMSNVIRHDCDGDNLSELLNESEGYNKAISQWLEDVVGRDIALRLKDVCERYGMQDIRLEQLNMLKIDNLDLGDGAIIEPGKEVINVVANVLSAIAGVISAVVLPTVLGVAIGLIAWISVDIAAMLLGLLMMIPGWGLTILIGIAGVAVFNAVRKGMAGAKEQLIQKLQAAKLPLKARALISDDKITKSLAKADIEGKVRQSILKEESVRGMTANISSALGELIRKRAEDIKYVLESR